MQKKGSSNMTFKPSLPFDISKKNWNDDNLFPSEMYLDTNLALMLVLRQPNFYKVEEFLKEYAIVRGNNIFWSVLTESELFECIHVDTLKKKSAQFGYQPAKWKDMENELDQKNFSTINNESDARFTSAIHVLKQYGDVLDDLDSSTQPNSRIIIKENARKIYTTHGGGIKDAEHIAIANEYGINNILTNDSNNGNGFFRYPQQNIYGISKFIADGYTPNIKANEYKDLIREEDPSES